MIRIHFSDYFDVSSDEIEKYGAFNISLINDLPLFIDPFLLFNSKKDEYQKLHNIIIQYVKFLRDKSINSGISKGLLKAWFMFPEVKQNWLGYSKVGNSGSGLGIDFAMGLSKNLNNIFSDFGEERITKGSHLEKLCLINDGVGRDNISDFTTNLIKEFILNYTQGFAEKYISKSYLNKIMIDKVRFNYHTETWEKEEFILPCYGYDYVLLTPKDILTKDETWINKVDIYHVYYTIANSVPNEQLRGEIDNYFKATLPKKPKNKEFSNKELSKAIYSTFQKFPVLFDYYVKHKEDTGDQAENISNLKVFETEQIFVKQVHEFVKSFLESSDFYKSKISTYQETREKVFFLKDVIENKGGQKLFYYRGKPIGNENSLQILFRFVWLGSPSDVSREVNDGRGPVDYKISRGSKDKSLVEFKLASNTQLKRNLEKQVEIYQKASDADKALKVILFFTERDLLRVQSILKDLGLEKSPDIILIDARNDNKPSGSNA